jgi:hypothetical protein
MEVYIICGARTEVPDFIELLDILREWGAIMYYVNDGGTWKGEMLLGGWSVALKESPSRDVKALALVQF